MLYIELHGSRALRAVVIETARSVPGARRMARVLARQRFGDPEFVLERAMTGGGYWREKATDGDTAGESIKLTGAQDDTQ